MIRVLVAPGTLVAEASIPLDEEEAHHLRVRRAATGDAILAYDGTGGIGHGVLTVHGKGFTVALTAVVQSPPPVPLVLAVAAGDRDRFLRLAEQCTELGVTTLIPLMTDRVMSVESRMREPALEKARLRARGACKQSGNPWATLVESFTRLQDLSVGGPHCQWLLADPTGEPLSAQAVPTACGWLIGPEGGFTAAELTFATAELRARRTWLAPHILRFETAALSAVTLMVDRRGPPVRET
jgi:16S rRNA (uracil1498-N3)-methyltransferase